MVVNTILQGAGLGFVFIPLQVIAFATLDPALRTEGTALLSLLRNVGSAIGISVTGAMVTQNGQIEHSVLTGYITPLNRAFQVAAAGLMPTTAHGAQMLNGLEADDADVAADASSAAIDAGAEERRLAGALTGRRLSIDVRQPVRREKEFWRTWKKPGSDQASFSDIPGAIDL